MQVDFDKVRWSEDSEGFWLSLGVAKDTNRTRIKEFVTGFKGLHTAVLKLFREKRSLDANAYMWVLLSKLANVMGTDKDKLYLEVLTRYGVFTHIVVKHAIVERVKAEWRTVRELGEVSINGKTGIQLQCYFGSSTYDTEEMARLIDGVVSECQDIGIETKTPDELSRLKEQWGK